MVEYGRTDDGSIDVANVCIEIYKRSQLTKHVEAISRRLGALSSSPCILSDLKYTWDLYRSQSLSRGVHEVNVLTLTRTERNRVNGRN